MKFNCLFLLLPFSLIFSRVTHYIVVKRDVTAIEQDLNIQQMHQELKKVFEKKTC